MAKRKKKTNRKPRRNYHQYLVTPTQAHVGQEDYFISPGTAFLKYTIEAKDAIEYCKNNFPSRKNKLVSAAEDSLQNLIVAVLPAVMGHFETFQRHLFAGAFDYSIYLEDFDIDDFIKNKSMKVQIDLPRVLAYRGQGASSIGMLLSDALHSWHDPVVVNSYFKALMSHNLFSAQYCDNLSILWQLRHSIVHTGGTLTLPDSQKNKNLSTIGTTQIAFDKGFTWQLSRKMHKLVKNSVNAFGEKYIAKVKSDTPEDIRVKIEKFFEVTSTNNNFFR